MRSWYEKIGDSGISKIYNETFKSVKGTYIEKSVAAVAAVVESSGGALKFYVTTNTEKTKAEEVKK